MICGLGGNDVIDGGNGSDTIYGGPGDDILVGGGGNGSDALHGEDGADEIYGGGGGDFLDGGAGDDSLNGENGPDTLIGGAGSDLLFGGAANDDLTGGLGLDAADGGSGSDTCRAETVVACEQELPDEIAPLPEALVDVSPAAGDTVFGLQQITGTVSPVDAEGSIRLLVAGAFESEGATVDGVGTVEWDTTVVVDGPMTLTVELADIDGNLVDSLSFEVTVANQSDTASRLLLDFESGELTTEEYVRNGLYSLTLPELVADRYTGTESDREPSSELLPYFLEFHNLTSTEQQSLTEYLDAFVTGDPILGDLVDIEVPPELEANSAGGGPLMLAGHRFMGMNPAILLGQVVYDDGGVNPGLGGWRGCTDADDWHPGSGVEDHSCVLTVDRFEFHFSIDKGGNDMLDPLVTGVMDGGQHGVPDDDDDGLELIDGSVEVGGSPNQVPDMIDRWAAALLNGWDSYDSIGMVDPSLGSEIIRVNASDTGLLPAHVFPFPIGSRTTIALDTFGFSGSGSTDFTVRHELFHVLQFGMASNLNGIDWAFYESIKAFMEGSAQWGADYSESNAWIVGAGRLERFVYRTNDPIFDFSNVGAEAEEQYGSFIFSEYIEERFPDTKMSEIWGNFGGGSNAGNMVVNAIGPGYADFHADFWASAYLLKQFDNTHLLGFSASGTADEAAVLTAAAKRRPGTRQADEQSLGARLIPGFVSQFDYQDGLRPGGAVVWELAVPATVPGVAIIEVDSVADVEYRTITTEGFPSLCAGADPTYAEALPTEATTVSIDGSCEVVAVLATRTDIETNNFFGGTRTPGFTAEFVPSPDLTVDASATPSPATPGELLEYAITVSNNSVYSSTETYLQLSRPDWLLDLQVTPGGPECSVGESAITCVMTGVAPSASTVVNVSGTLDPSVSGDQTLTGFVESWVRDPHIVVPDKDPSNNAFTLVTPIDGSSGADLEVGISVDPFPPVVGRRAVVSYTVTNHGPDPAIGVQLTGQMPTQFDIVADQLPADCSLGPDTGAFSCSLGDIAPGGSDTRLIVVDVVAPIDILTEIVGSVSSSTSDPDPGNNNSTFDFALLFIQVNPIPCQQGCAPASSWGDPHLRTFDGVAYDLQTVGEFVLMRTNDGAAEVHTRHTAMGTSASGNTAVAAQIGPNRVGLYVDRGLLVNGVEIEIPSGESYDLGDGARIYRFGSRYTLAWPGPDEQRLRLDMSLGRGAIHVNAFLPPSLSGQVSGLLGNGDGSTGDDFQAADGTVFQRPLSTSVLYGQFADEWRIIDTTSLFDYLPGESTLTFTDLVFPAKILRIEDLDPAEVALAEGICRGAGVVDETFVEMCIVDLVITGDTWFVSGALGATPPVSVEAGAYFEDFEDGTASGWSPSLISLTEMGERSYLGPFSGGTASLNLTELPPHTGVTIAFDLFIMGGWDGDETPDRLFVEKRNGEPILDATFSNGTATQSYPTSGSAAQTGAVEIGTLGDYGGGGSSAYHVEATVPSWEQDVTFDFTGLGVDPSLGEFWGLDNVEVKLAQLPPEHFDYTIGTSVTEEAEAARAEDLWGFSVPAGGLRVYFDWRSCFFEQRSELLDSSGAVVPIGLTKCSEGFVDLAEGDYTLRVWSIGPHAVGTYEFQVWSVPDPEGPFGYTVGDVTTVGVPDPGAGNIEQVGSEDLWGFSVPAGGLRVYFDWRSCFFEQRSELLDSSGAVVPIGLTKCSEGFVDLAEGDYTLRVWSIGPHAVGTYEFQIVPQ